MERLERRVQSAAQALALVGFLGLLGLAIMTTLDVLLRWLLGMPIQGVNDVSSIVMAVVIAACIPANLAMKQNISVEVFGAVGGPRFHRLLDAFASLLTLVFIVLVAWRFVPYAAGLRMTGDRTWVLGWAIWPWWACAAAAMIVAAVVQFLVTLVDLHALMRGRGGDRSSRTDGSAETHL